ncbi:MAG: patatin-like phospholipase family protein [Desulfobulbaceae bacterium]
MGSNNLSVWNAILTFIGNIPDCIDGFIRRVDAYVGGTGTVKRFHDRSLLAFFLPIPVYVFILFGPTLAWGHGGDRGWLNIWAAVFLLTLALVIQLRYFLQNSWHGMAWLQFGLITVLVISTWIIGDKHAQATHVIYCHYYSCLSLIALSIAVPIAYILMRWKVFALPDDAIKKFNTADHFDANKIADQGSPKGFNKWDVIGAFLLVIMRKPLHMITPVALVVLLVPQDPIWPWAITALFFSWMLFAAGNYDPDRDAFVRLVHHIFFTGGTLLVTLVIVLLAILRFAGVSYVTTIFDAGSKLLIFSYIFSTYSLFWFYDFWIDQATLDLLNDFNKFKNPTGRIERHGGGRIAVIPNEKGKNMRMFEPSEFLNQIVQTAPESARSDLREEAVRVVQRFRVFAGVCSLSFVAVLVILGLTLHRLDQEPGLVSESTDARIYDLSESLLASGEKPVIMLAASGGGTRAALYTTAVLHGIWRLDQIDSLILASGVSGGSAALSYFAIHKPSLRQKNDEAWEKMRKTLASPFIEDVIAGAGEWRVVSSVRLGQLLTESFQRRFLHTGLSEEVKRRVILSGIKDMGLIFNTSLCGSPATEGSKYQKTTASSAGGLLVVTNLASNFSRKPATGDGVWGFDLPYKIVNDPQAELVKAASLSANFPPVFSNTAVTIDGKPFWVTDGGAVENRGIISVLLALVEALETLQKRGQVLTLPEIIIIVADASAFGPDYKSDRGVGAKFGASEKIADGLIKELFTHVEQLHESISKQKNKIRLVYLPMPDAMRAKGTFGTHWMMPSKVMIKDPFSGKDNGIEVKKEDLEDLIDRMFSRDYSDYIKGKWSKKSDAEYIMKVTKQPFDALEASLKKTP